MKFHHRKRTDFLCVHTRDTGGLSVGELQNEAKRKGLFAIGYHYVIQAEGLVEPGRGRYEIAGHDLRYPESSLYVLIDSQSHKRLSDSQRYALKALVEDIKAEYPHIKIVKE